jgi:hypothetical protein
MARPPKYPVIERVVEGKTLLFKTCTKCKEEKVLNDFAERKGALHNKGSWCTACEKDKFKKLRERNKEKHKEYYKKYCEEHVEEERERKRRYYQANKERLKPIRREWVLANKDKVSDIQKRWRINNKDFSNAKNHKRLARKAKLFSDWSSSDVTNLLKDFNKKCKITGSDKYHVDHFVALATGHCGTYRGNMILLDELLNMSKGADNPFEWIKKFPEYGEGFTEVIKYLAEINNLSVNEFEDFVYWCYKNKRSTDEILSEEPSISLWGKTREASE